MQVDRSWQRSQRIVVPNEPFELRHLVIERPRSGVVFLGEPIEALGLMRPSHIGHGLNQGPCQALTSCFGSDEEVLQITNRGHPGAGVKEEVGQSHQLAVDFNAHAVNAVLRTEALPRGVQFGVGDRGLVESFVSASQHKPGTAVVIEQGGDGVCHAGLMKKCFAVPKFSHPARGAGTMRQVWGR